MRAWLGVAVVVVRVYDVSGIGDVDRRSALDVARELLAEANVHVIFKTCDVTALNGDACDTPPKADERIVRILNAPPHPEPGTEAALGTALVDRNTRKGVLATAFADRIARKAHSAPARRLLLGRVVAHELGHLLLGVREHSESGLMREFWTDREVRQNESLDWAFSPDDRQRICANLLGRQSLCGSSRGQPGRSDVESKRSRQ